MGSRDAIDLQGATLLVAFSVLFGLNQVAIKVTADGLQPVLSAGLRSAGAMVCLLVWMRLRGIPLRLEQGTLGSGLLIGAFFSMEFVFLFLALDLTTVVRASVLFYSMPVWLAIAAHFLLPGERMHRRKALGLVIAMAGVVFALISRAGGPVVPSDGATGSLTGDLLAVGASFGWAGIALCARATAMSRVRPEIQLFWQLLVSAPVLLALSPLFGPFLRDLAPLHLWSLAFQTVVVVTGGFIMWLWLLSVYPASSVASFAFLTPIFGVGLGWVLLDEPVGAGVLVSAGLVACGLVLINRPPPRSVPA